MPYPNEHAFRVKEPSEFESDSFRTKNIANGIDIIVGKLKNGNGSMTTQTYRFKADIFSFDEAKKWMNDHDIKYISAEKASGEAKSKIDKIFKNISKPRQWFNIEIKEDIPEVCIYDMIGSSLWEDAINPTGFRNQIKKLEEDKHQLINIRINSPGGIVYDGLSIYNTLQQTNLEKHVYIDGLAASAASFVAMAGDKIFMPETAEMMIHNAWGFSSGNAKDLRKDADHLEALTKIISNIYIQKTGLPEKEILDMMDKETWMNGQEAIEKGFADELLKCKAAACLFELDNDIFSNIPTNFLTYQRALQKRIKEKELRDAGSSRNEAKKVSSQRDAAKDSEQQINYIINNLKEITKCLK